MKVKYVVTTERRNFGIGSEFVTKIFKNYVIQMTNFVAGSVKTFGY